MARLSDVYRSWDEMIIKALELDIENKRNIYSKKIVYITGMGGSGIIGDFIRKIFEEEFDKQKIMILSGKHAYMPSYLKDFKKELFLIAVSYSGDTAETLRVYRRSRDENIERGVVTSGGALYEEASRDGAPIVKVEKGLLPRASLPYLFIGALKMIELLGLDMEVIKSSLKNLSKKVSELDPLSERVAEEVIEDIRNKRRIVFISTYKYDVVTERFRTEYAENLKYFVETAVFPEAGHNFIETLREGLSTSIYYIHDPIDLESELVYGLLRKISEKTEDLRLIEIALPENESYISKMFAGAYIAGLSSSIAAERLGIDPSYTGNIKMYRDHVSEYYMTH